MMNYSIIRAIIEFDNKNVNEALRIIDKLDLTNFSTNNVILLNKAFLLSMSGDLHRGFSIYKKVLNKKNVDCNLINSALSFIDRRLDDDKSNNYLLFCESIINYYRRDRILAEKNFDVLLYNNDQFSVIFKEIYNNLVT